MITNKNKTISSVIPKTTNQSGSISIGDIIYTKSHTTKSLGKIGVDLDLRVFQSNLKFFLTTKNNGINHVFFIIKGL